MRRAVVAAVVTALGALGLAAPSGAEVVGGASTRPSPSSGCDAPAVAPGEERITTTAGGVERWYLRHVPPAYDGTEPLPVVVDLHGYLEGAAIHAVHTQLGAFGDEHGFITLTPHGTGDPVRWESIPGSSDTRFLAQLLDETEETLCVDRRRVYVTGLSNGAMMTSVLGCDLADRIAAIAPVAGIVEVRRCKAVRPMPVVAFHGVDDRFLAFEGGLGDLGLRLPRPTETGPSVGATAREVLGDKSIPEKVAVWAERNGCAPKPKRQRVAEDVIVHRYRGCDDGSAVHFYELTLAGHTWPGSEFSRAIESSVGYTTFSISANAVMWEFFQRHRLPE